MPLTKMDSGEMKVLREHAKAIAELPESVTRVIGYAAGDTVRSMQKRARLEMSARFDRPTPFMLNSVKTIMPGGRVGGSRTGGGVMNLPGGRMRTRGIAPQARRPIGEAGIYFEEFNPRGTAPADVIEPHIIGGQRSLKRGEKRARAMIPGFGGSHYVPGRNTPRDQYGNVSGARMSQILFELNTFDSARNDPGKTERKSRKTKSYFLYYGRQKTRGRPIGIAERSADGKTLSVVMRFIRPVNYRKRYPLHEFSREQVYASLPDHFFRQMNKEARRLKLI
jgi:hypothetical protein